jgi:hypothetical protein
MRETDKINSPTRFQRYVDVVNNSLAGKRTNPRPSVHWRMTNALC